MIVPRPGAARMSARRWCATRAVRVGRPRAVQQLARGEVELQRGAEHRRARPSRHRRRCPPRRSTWATPNAAVAAAVAASPRPWRPTSWAVTAGQPGSRPRRCSSTHPRHAERPGSTSGPTTPDAVAQPDGQVRDAVAVQGGDPLGSGTTASASTHRSGAARGRGRPDARPGATRRTTSTTASARGPAPVGVEQTRAEVALLHRTVRPRPRPTRHRCRHVRARPRHPPRAGRRPPR